MLHLAKNLAMAVEEAGNTAEAYDAYTRVLEGYRTSNMPASYEIRSMLTLMATTLWAVGDDYRAQRFAWQALESRDPPHRAQTSDVGVLKAIAKSLLRTSIEIPELIKAEMQGEIVCNCNSLLPALHSMVESNYASQVSGNVFQPGLHAYSKSGKCTESSIVGGIDAVVEFLEEFSDLHLEVRDSNKRTPLILAVAGCREAFGLGLMARTTNNDRFRKRLINARDGSGQTVLSLAIASGCSLSFITALIVNGAVVDPDAVQFATTPLQAACYRGCLDIVELLLGEGPNIDTAFPGSSTPLAIAEELEYFEIASRLTYASPGSLSSHTVREGDNGG